MEKHRKIEEAMPAGAVKRRNKEYDMVKRSLKSLSLVMILLLVAMFIPLYANGQEESSGSADSDLKWPVKPIQLVVPSSAGGDTDWNCRLTAKYLQKELGVPVLTVNIKGGGGTVGSKEVMNAEPNGYYGLYFHNSMIIAKLLGLADFGIVDFAMAGVTSMDPTNAFIASADSPYQTLDDIIAQLKKEPGSVSYAATVGAFTHLHMLAFERATGTKFNLVDAGNAADKIVALKGGQIDVMGNSYGLVTQYIDNGDFVCPGYMAEEPIPGVKAKTFKEQGIDVSFNKFYFIALPKDTDPRIVKIFNDAIKRVGENPDYIKELATHYNIPSPMTPEASRQLYLDTEKYYETFKDEIKGN